MTIFKFFSYLFIYVSLFKPSNLQTVFKKCNIIFPIPPALYLRRNPIYLEKYHQNIHISKCIPPKNKLVGFLFFIWVSSYKKQKKIFSLDPYLVRALHTQTQINAVTNHCCCSKCCIVAKSN